MFQSSFRFSLCLNPFRRWLLALTPVLVGLALPVAAQPYGLDQRPVVGAFLNGALPPAEAAGSTNPAAVQAGVVFPGVTFDSPTVIVAEPNSPRMYVGERGGKIFFFTNTPSVTQKTMFLNLSPTNQGHYYCELLGLAFHPQFNAPGGTNRYVYAYYTIEPDPIEPGGIGDVYLLINRLARYTVPAGSLVADPASRQILINQLDRHTWHQGGGMFFGSDGFLYLSIGDEGGNYDFYNQSQKINAGLFSGVLRIDVDKDATKSHPIPRQPITVTTPPAGWPNTYTSNYFVPNDNPWVTNNNSVLEEFYAIGFRSPHRMTYDAVSNRIWLGDVGQATWEEVDIVEKGGNYQWAYREGFNAADSSLKPKPNPLIGTDKPPVHNYIHGNGDNSVIGGFVYRGSELPALYGKYIFSDNGSSRVWSLTYDGVPQTVVTQLCIVPAPVGSYGVTTIGADLNNEIYFGIGGDGVNLYKLTLAGAQPPPPPPLLSQTGVFTNLLSMAPHAAMVPFDINAPLWSDHAAKQRWMIVPNNGAPYGAGETIGYSSNGNWSFPTGTVLVKHFDLPVNDTNPSVFKRLETRFLVFGTNAQWYGLTYKWRSDNTEADLLPGGLNETNFITTATGLRTQVWSYPSRSDCRTCHNGNAGGVLGPRTSQLNGNMIYPATGITDNQLRTLNHIGMFNTALSEAQIPTLPKTYPLNDTNAPLETRVRSYLQANCAHCHQPNGARSFFDARYATPPANQGIVGGAVDDNLGIAGAKVVRPQSLSQSILYLRDNALGSIAMPPLAKNVVDTNYINMLAAWINNLPPVVDLPSGLPGLVGNTDTSAALDTLYDGAAYINATRFRASSNFTAAFIRARVTNITGSYKCAIYAGTAAAPGALLAATTPVTNPATDWQTFTLATPLLLTNGNYYWLAVWSDSPNAGVFRSGTGVLQWGQYNYGAWPNPLNTTGTNNYNYSIYAASGARPVFVATPTNRTIVELATLTVTNYATDADLPAQGLTYYLLNPPAGAAISANGVITWTPSDAQGPSTNQIVTAATDGVFSITNTFQVVVTNGNMNIAPVANSQSVTNAEDTLLNLTLTGTDPDGPVMNFVVVTNPAHGVLSVNGPNLTYLPDTNYFGADSLAFQVNDGSLTSAVASVSVTVTNLNDAPEAISDDLLRWASQGAATTTVLLLTNDVDADGDTLALLGVTNATPIGATLAQSNNTVVYWPSFGDTNAGSFNYIIADGHGGSATGLVSVAVQPDPAGDDVLGLTAASGSEVTISLSGIPGFTYTVQYTDSLMPPAWLNLTVDTADGLGQINVNVTMPEGSTNRFYRAVRGILPNP